MTTFFHTYTLDGKPLRRIDVDTVDLKNTAAAAAKVPAHHILIVDRSGSMYSAMADLRQMLEKLLTLEEFNDPTLVVSLLSYSSQGDLRTHFARTTVAGVMSAGSKDLAEIRNLHVSGLTCISQALLQVPSLVTPGEVTAVTLHSDGYANHLSPTEEARQIKKAVDAIKVIPGVFCNTVAYGSYCDFNMLTAIANSLSGVCVQASSIKEVYTAIRNTTELLAGKIAPAKEMLIGKGSMVGFLSRTDKKVLASTESLLIRGLSDAADATGFRFTEGPATAGPDTATPESIMVYARGRIALGDFVGAKTALAGRQTSSVLRPHARALVATDIANFVTALDAALFSGRAPVASLTDGIVSGNVATIVDVLGFLGQHTDGFSLNLEAFRKTYKRRGLTRLQGTRQADGTVVPPAVDVVPVTAETHVKVSSFDTSRNTATINMLISQQAQMITKATGDVLKEVAGIPLKLHTFNNYTLVGDGVVCTPTLTIKAWDRRVVEYVQKLPHVVEPTGDLTILLSEIPLVPYSGTFTVTKDQIQELFEAAVVLKFLEGQIKGTSEAYTPEQVAALDAVHLSPKLNFSPPTCNDYTDKDEARNTGKIDSRISTKVDVGTVAVTGAGKLYSGNEYLQRRFVVTLKDGTVPEKANLTMLREEGVKVSLKTLTARTKLTEVDDLTFPIYAGALGLGDATKFKAIAGTAATVEDQIKAVKAKVEALYENTVIPLAFYVGATGMVPDFGSDVRALTSDELVALHPTVKLDKAEREEGTFYVLPSGVMITAYAKSEDFTPA